MPWHRRRPGPPVAAAVRTEPLAGQPAPYAVWALLCLIVLGLLFPGDALGHASFLRSSPSLDAVLDEAPPELTIEFSEPLDPSFSSVELVKASGIAVETGPGRVDTGTPATYRLPLPALAEGSYEAHWRARSAIDGHLYDGTVRFTVGSAAAAALPTLPALRAGDPATMLPGLQQPVLHWLNLVLAAIAFGGFPFLLFVWNPARRRAARKAGGDEGRAAAQARSTSAGEAERTLVRRIRLAALGAAALSLATNLGLLLTLAAEAAQVSLLAAVGEPLLDLFAGRSGQIWAARVLLTLAFLVIVWRLPSGGPFPLGSFGDRPPGPAGSRRATNAGWPWWACLLLSLAILATFSLNSHGAGLPEGAALAVALDLIHAAVMVAWVGGLVVLSWVLRQAGRGVAGLPLQELVPSFSRLALVCVGLLGLTGLYATSFNLGDPRLLLETSYGRALLVKVALFAFLLALGGVNRFLLIPRLQRDGDRLAGRLRAAVRLEAGLALMVLLAVGVMLASMPGKQAWRAHEDQGIYRQVRVDEELLLDVRIAPLTAGEATCLVRLPVSLALAAGQEATVWLRFTPLDAHRPPILVQTQTRDGVDYAVRAALMPEAGDWQGEVLVSRPGVPGVRYAFAIRAGARR